jgi:hypothetical protein
LIAETAVAWVDTNAVDAALAPVQPPVDPNVAVASDSYSIVQSISQVDMRCITRDYKPRSGKLTPFVYIGANAAVVRTEIQNTGFRSAGFRRQDFETRSIGAGTYNVIGLNPTADVLYLGSSLGLGIEVGLESFNLKRLFFAPDDEFLSLIIDRDVSFWGTRESSIYRVNADSFSVFASTTVPRGLLRSVVDDGRNLHFASATAGVTGREFYTFAVRKTNCSSYSCDSCFTTDTNYCGVCKTTGLCTLETDCVDNSWLREGLCPASFTVKPVSASVEGNTEVTITGAFFESSGHQCVFNYDLPGNEDATQRLISVAPNVERSTTTTLICTVPRYPTTILPNNTRTIQVGVTWTSNNVTRTWGGYLGFTYYSCASLGCAQCFSSQFGDCGWCLGTGSCSTQQLCAGADQFTTAGCPAIQSVTPNYGSVAGGEDVVVKVSELLTTGNYECQFGNVKVIATKSGNDTLRCTTPSFSSEETVRAVSLSIFLNTGSGYVLHTPSNGTFDYYNCTVFSRCDLCVNPRAPKCRWCKSSLTCGESSDSGFCPVADVTTSCPVINLLRPNSDFVPTAPTLYQPTQITLVGANFQQLPNMQCVFQRPNGAATITGATIPALSNDVVCSTPNTVVTEEYSVYIAGGSPIVQQTSAIPFLFYDCTGTSCADCVESRKKVCRWCPFLDTANPLAPNQQFCFISNTGRNCSTSAGDPSGGEVRFYASCPVLTAVSPDGDSIQGSSTITLSGDLIFEINANITYECEFTLTNGSRLRSSAIVDTVTRTAQCSARASGYVQTARVRLLRSGVGFTNYLPFRYYDCAALLGCSSCLNPSVYPACTWCATTCTSKASCAQTKRVNSNCPRILRALPEVADVGGGDPIILEGGPFVASDSSSVYECIWNNVLRIEGQFLDSTRVSCTSPRQSVSNATLSLNFAGVSYAPESVNVEFFSCSPVPGDFCPDACTAQKHCGWCLTTSTCGSQAKCPSLWLDKCVRPVFNQNHANLEGNETVITYLEDNLLQTVVDGSTFVNVLEEDLRCYFGSGTAGVDVSIARDTESSNITCLAPPSATEDQVEFRILYRDKKLFDDTATRFSYVNCRAVSRCEECVIKDFCGWCGDSNSCSTRLFCPLGNFTQGPGNCPDILEIRPLNGDVNGGTEVTISGQFFIANENLQLYWDGTPLAKTTWRVVNSQTIRATTPSSVKADIAIPIELKFDTPNGNSTRYAIRPGQFTYFDPRAATIRTAVGATAGVVGAILIAVVVFFWYKRRFSGGMIVVVKEPDYVLVAYGSDLEQKYRLPDDNYIKLETALMRPDFGLQMGISSVCPSTEQDAIAKSLVHIAYSHNDPTFVIDMINEAVRAEVASCIQENTIFRGNSIASKMFKFYSRMVGIRYLWRFIARVIAEIETLGRKELNEKLRAEKDAASGKKSKEASLLDISMELDEAKMAKGDTDVDLDTNILQLKLTCQKLFSVIVKNSLKDFPTEFRQIFVNIDACVMGKFQSNDATYKAIGGFFFLRFVCPAITAPHVYGLLDTPPNTLTQRQLVLISKVLQSLANMALPGKKEKYMTLLLDFIESGIPKMGKFYDEIRKHTAFVEGAEYEYTDIGMPPVVKNNALGTTWNFIFLNQDKTLQSFSQVGVDKSIQRELQDGLEEMIYTYKSAPKKFVAKKTKKGKAPAAAVPE